MIGSNFLPFLQLQQNLLEQNHEFLGHLVYCFIQAIVAFFGYVLFHCFTASIIHIVRKIFNVTALLKGYAFVIKACQYSNIFI